MRWIDVNDEDPPSDELIFIELKLKEKTVYRIGKQVTIATYEGGHSDSEFQDLFIINTTKEERSMHFCIYSYDRWIRVC